MSTVETTVCHHGWPMFDQEPCPDCLRELEAHVTEPVTENLDIPDFLKRSGTEPDDRLIGPQTPVGGGSAPTDAIPTYRQMFPRNPKDDEVVAEIKAKRNAKIVASSTRKKTVTAREGAYAEGKSWDQTRGKWI